MYLYSAVGSAEMIFIVPALSTTIVL